MSKRAESQDSLVERLEDKMTKEWHQQSHSYNRCLVKRGSFRYDTVAEPDVRVRFILGIA